MENVKAIQNPETIARLEAICLRETPPRGEDGSPRLVRKFTNRVAGSTADYSSSSRAQPRKLCNLSSNYVYSNFPLPYRALTPTSFFVDETRIVCSTKFSRHHLSKILKENSLRKSTSAINYNSPFVLQYRVTFVTITDSKLYH